MSKAEVRELDRLHLIAGDGPVCDECDSQAAVVIYYYSNVNGDTWNKYFCPAHTPR